MTRSNPAETSEFALVAQLAFARENATPGLERGREVLSSALLARDASAELQPFEHARAPADAVAVALVLLAASLCAVAWRRRRRTALALAAPLLLLLLAAIDKLPGQPKTLAHNIECVVEPRAAVEAEIVLVAHYDTKTEWLDHVQRTLLFVSTAALVVIALLRLWRGGRGSRALTAAAALALAVAAAQLLSGRFVRERSPGVIDNAAACAILVDVATSVHDAPLERTRLRCLWPAAEELGALGSAAFVAAYRPDVPAAIVNLEALGAGEELVWAAFEWTRRGPRRADAALGAKLAASAPRPVRAFAYPVLTDAGPFLDAGHRALTLLSLPADDAVPRGLHSGRDDLQRFDPAAAALARTTLQRFVRHVDAHGLD